MRMINLMFIQEIIMWKTWNPSLTTYLTLIRYSWSLFITILDYPSGVKKSLERLWRDSLSGHLDKVAELHLNVTGEMTKKLNLDTICLKTTLAEENYLNCKGALIEIPRTRSGWF